MISVRINFLLENINYVKFKNKIKLKKIKHSERCSVKKKKKT